jgi:DNA-binding transcriptional regulator YdaS (Cro superfamily)
MANNPTALERACKAAGSQTKLGLLLGRKKAAVSRWKREGIPAEVCPDIERLTGVPCEELRPDLTWVRVKDKRWPNPKGRPLLDVAAPSDGKGR